MSIRPIFVALVLSSYGASGCASSSKPAEEGHEEHEHEHEHESMSGGIKAFHDVLAPIFHADKGPARNDKACGAVASFKEHGAAIVAEAKSEGGKKAGEGVVGATADLEKACGVEGKADVEAKLDKLHEAFHAAMEAK